MKYINDPNHESAKQSPEQTVNPAHAFGAGTLAPKPSSAPLQERSLQVEITNPAMRRKHSPAKREEKQRLTARSVDVVARSGNQRPSEVDQRIPDGFIWGMAGSGDAPAAPAMDGVMDTVRGLATRRNLMIAGGVAAFYFMFMR